MKLRLTQFETLKQFLCHAVVVSIVTACLPKLHAWCSVHLVYDQQKSLLYTGYTVGCFNNDQGRDYDSTPHFHFFSKNICLHLVHIHPPKRKAEQLPTAMHLLFTYVHIAHHVKFGTSLFVSDFSCCMNLRKHHTEQMKI